MIRLLKDNWFPVTCVIFAAGGGWVNMSSLEKQQGAQTESIRKIWGEQGTIKETLSRLDERGQLMSKTLERIENKLDKVK